MDIFSEKQWNFFLCGKLRKTW